ncbi:MAG: tetratricopeptide repeat protein [Thermodesulfobacteriota bacterium]|nr:tetratricopeptide repeat protein [Thermodesulfobacteriota bacterium]
MTNYKLPIKHLRLVICLALTLLTLATFWQVQYNEFINLDDNQYIYENMNIRPGLSWKGAIWAFRFNDTSYWHPLTWLSHMLDYQLYGLNPKGHHLNNLLIHIANTILLFLILNRMTGALWRSAIVAAMFGLHPINVESVAWATNRKNVLSTLFWMLTIWNYSSYIQKPGIIRYLMVFLSLALGLMAKPIVVTLPFALLLLDYWPLYRYKNMYFNNNIKNQKSMVPGYQWSTFRLVFEKIPLFALSASSIYLSLLSSQRLDIVIPIERIPICLRIENALVSLVFYIKMMIWPRDLAVFYPYPLSIPFWHSAGAGLLLAVLTIIIIRRLNKFPYLSIGWLWYIGTLLPVIGLAEQGLWPAVADRFAYIPLIGLFIIIVWGFYDMGQKCRFQKVLFPVLTGSILSCLLISTWMQVQYWKNSITLLKHAVDVTANNHLAHYNLGAALHQKGMVERAIWHYTEALKIMPDNAQFHVNLGAALFQQKKLDQAINHFSEALRTVPEYAEAYFYIGSVLDKQGKPREAISHYYQALRIKPLAEAHHRLGLILAGQGKLEIAVSHYHQALRIKPDYAKAHNDLGVALSWQGKFQEAISHYIEALRINPDFYQARRNLNVIQRKLKTSYKQ